jgi:hypothetical protein
VLKPESIVEQPGLEKVSFHKVDGGACVKGLPFASSARPQPCSPAVLLLPNSTAPPQQIHSWLAWILPPLALSLAPSASPPTPTFFKSLPSQWTPGTLARHAYAVSLWPPVQSQAQRARSTVFLTRSSLHPIVRFSPFASRHRAPARLY